jgi:hypothetical protein
MKIYIPCRVCLENIECEVENELQKFEHDSKLFEIDPEIYTKNPNFINFEVKGNHVKYELLITKYYVNVETVEELLKVLSYFCLYDPETKSLVFEED